MTNTPIYVADSPANGTHYFMPNSGYWFIPNAGSTVTTFVYAHALNGGNGSLVVCGDLTSSVSDFNTATFHNFTASGANSATAATSSGTNGSDIWRGGGWWDTSGSPGSLAIYCSYTGTPCLPTGLTLSKTGGSQGTTLTITGTYLDGVTSVVFAGNVGASYTFSGDYSSGTLSITIPSGAQTGAIALNSPNGTVYTRSFGIRTNITGWSTNSGHVGDSITLNGSGFNSCTGITFAPNGTSASFTVVSDSQATVTVPDAGTGNITTNSAGGTFSFGTWHTVPTVTSYNVSSGPPGTSVTVNGTGFTQVTGVNFYNGVAASYTVVSTTQITTTVPGGAVKGAVSVTSSGGTGNGPSFSVTPTISSLSTSSGHVGDSISINGSGFTGTTGVTFTSSVSASYTINSDSKLTVTVPAGAVKGIITVVNAGGSVSSNTFLVYPSISSISPSTAPPGTSVTISGSGFTGTTAVTFYNNVAATAYTVVNDSTITTTVPNGATSGPVSVTNASGTATSGTETVSSAHVYRTGAWTQAQNVYVYRSGSWTPAAGVFVYRNGQWVSAG